MDRGIGFHPTVRNPKDPLRLRVEKRQPHRLEARDSGVEAAAILSLDPLRW
jgi:hypothetical protein